MHIRDTHKCNLWNLQKLAGFLDTPKELLLGYYEELTADAGFLAQLNANIRRARQCGFRKGIFRKPRLSSLNWFAFERVLLYVLVRHLKPALCLETGVYYGGNSAFLLAALAHNGAGRLISIDYPDADIRRDGALPRHADVGDSEWYDQPLQPGFLVPEAFRPHWELILGNSLAVIPTLDHRFDFYIHDSEHSYDFMLGEMTAVQARAAPNAVMIVDDIDWSNAFYSFCSRHALFPLLLTDNGKDDLRVRTGLVKLDHPKNRHPDIVGHRRRAEHGAPDHGTDDPGISDPGISDPGISDHGTANVTP
jgi:hypothetical protein